MVVYIYLWGNQNKKNGNTLEYAKDGVIQVTEIIEENNYSPFGLKHKGYNNIANSNRSEAAERYKFNGMEWQPELGLDLYDFGARNYDPSIGRWLNVDPLAEVSRRWTPYNYAYNNPIYFVDPDGMLSGSFNNGYFKVDIEQFGGSMESWAGGFQTEGSDGVQQAPPDGGNDNPEVEVAVQNTHELSTTPDDGGGDENGSDGNGNGGGNGKSKNSKEPVYHYNGKKYSDGAELYFAILLDTAAEQFGITDIIALGTAIDGLGFVDKPFQMKGASKGTSLLSKGLSSQFPQKMPWTFTKTIWVITDWFTQIWMATVLLTQPQKLLRKTITILLD